MKAVVKLVQRRRNTQKCLLDTNIVQPDAKVTAAAPVLSHGCGGQNLAWKRRRDSELCVMVRDRNTALLQQEWEKELREKDSETRQDLLLLAEMGGRPFDSMLDLTSWMSEMLQHDNPQPDDKLELAWARAGYSPADGDNAEHVIVSLSSSSGIFSRDPSGKVSADTIQQSVFLDKLQYFRSDGSDIIGTPLKIGFVARLHRSHASHPLAPGQCNQVVETASWDVKNGFSRLPASETCHYRHLIGHAPEETACIGGALPEDAYMHLAKLELVIGQVLQEELSSAGVRCATIALKPDTCSRVSSTVQCVIEQLPEGSMQWYPGSSEVSVNLSKFPCTIILEVCCVDGSFHVCAWQVASSTFLRMSAEEAECLYYAGDVLAPLSATQVDRKDIVFI